jgi:hypothetical protein
VKEFVNCTVEYCYIDFILCWKCNILTLQQNMGFLTTLSLGSYLTRCVRQTLWFHPFSCFQFNRVFHKVTLSLPSCLHPVFGSPFTPPNTPSMFKTCITWTQKQNGANRQIERKKIAAVLLYWSNEILLKSQYEMLKLSI